MGWYVTYTPNIRIVESPLIPELPVGALLSASSSPQSFADFNISGQQVLALPYSKQTGEGVYCLPIDIGKLGLSDVKDGANVTLQIVFNGGDGNLYQVCTSPSILVSFIPSYMH
jgi:hypothetical protein